MRSNKQIQNDTNIDTSQVKEIDLKSLFSVIKRHFWIVLLFATITASIGYYFDSNNKPIYLYESFTRLHLNSDGGIETLKHFIVDPLVLQEVISTLEIKNSVDALAGQIKVEHIGGQLLEISVIGSDPKLAADIANVTTEVFIQKAEKILQVTGINQYLKAEENPVPINAGEESNIKMTALIAGIVLGIGFVFLLNALDNTLISEQDIHKALGITVLGSVSKINKRNTHRRIKNQQIIHVRGDTIDS